MTVEYTQGAELPDFQLWWADSQGDLIDFSSGYTWTVRIGRVGETAVFEKTTGVTGAAGSGAEPDGTPNVVVAWAADDLTVDAGSYTLQLTARRTADSKDRIYKTKIKIKEDVEAEV